VSAASEVRRARANKMILLLVKVIHSLIWFGVEVCMGHLLYAGVKRRWDRRTAVSALVVIGETMVFVGSGWRCPLTGIANRLGAARASVTDIFLPRWFAAKLPTLHAPLIVLALWLHGSIMLERCRKRRRDGGAVATGDEISTSDHHR